MTKAGERLKKVRLEKGLSLEDAHKKTKIKLNILQALEGEGLTDVNPIYLKGFLKIYCNFLGVDSNDFVSDYKEPVAVAQVLKKPEEQKIKTPDKPVQLSRPQKIKLGSGGFKIEKFVVPVLAVLGIVILIFVVSKIISWRRNLAINRQIAAATTTKSEPKKQTVSKKIKVGQSSKQQVSKVSSSKEAAATKTDKIQSSLPVAIKDNSGRISLGIRTKENCWISLRLDGKLIFQRVLEKGRFESWDAKDKIELSLGNGNAVELQVNGQIFSNLGRKNQALKNIVITKEGLSVGK
jgi:cytoskeletal protein RodZ